MSELDWPPFWTVVGIVLALALGWIWPWTFLGAAGSALGVGIVIAGGILMAIAAAQMFLARTTLIPRKTPTRLVTRGIFALSRNPIYLGDLLIIAGAAVYFQALWALPLLAGFVWIIETRFILDEEARLRAKFGADFDVWAARTARWLNGVPYGNGLRR